MYFNSFLGRGVIDVPLHSVVDYIHKFHTRLEWDDFLMVGLCLYYYYAVIIMIMLVFNSKSRFARQSVMLIGYVSDVNRLLDVMTCNE